MSKISSNGQLQKANLDLRELGATGLRRQGGKIYEEYLPTLQGQRAIKVYREMRDNDAIIGASLLAIDMLIRGVTWGVEPYSQDREDLERAEFLDSCREDMSSSWVDLVSEILSYLAFGWDWHEIVYKRRQGASRDPSKRSKFTDGRIGWRKMPTRSQDTLYDWIFDEEGGIQGMKQQAPPSLGIVDIPIEKSLLFRTSASKNNPEGRSALRIAYKSWLYCKRIEDFEAIGIERDLAGIPTFGVPVEMLHADAPQAVKDTLEFIKTTAANVRRDEQEYIIKPNAYDDHGNPMFTVELLSSAGNRQFDTGKVIERYKRHMAMTLLTDVILLGHEKVGSFALADSKSSLLAYSLGALLQGMAGIFNTHAVPRLFEVNGFPTDRLPTITAGDVETVDLAEFGEFISKLAAAGFPLFPDDALENFIRQKVGFPEAPEDDAPDVPRTPVEPVEPEQAETVQGAEDPAVT